MRKNVLLAGLLAISASLVVVAAGRHLAYGNPIPEVPVKNHYLVYRVNNGPTLAQTLILQDQFESGLVRSMQLERFGNPVEKNGDEGPIIDPDWHLTWWYLADNSFTPVFDEVGVVDQFGYHEWNLHRAYYLAAPALKNADEGLLPPVANHYLCYEANGPSANKTVILYDQWGWRQGAVLQPLFFCNPVLKQLEDGETYPIIDRGAHLACYEFEWDMRDNINFWAIDQFGEWNLQTAQDRAVLCLPAGKMFPIATEESTWGRIKSLYKSE